MRTRAPASSSAGTRRAATAPPPMTVTRRPRRRSPSRYGGWLEMSTGLGAPLPGNPVQLLPVTPAESNEATSLSARTALCTRGSASSAPVPSPSRNPRSMSGLSPR